MNAAAWPVTLVNLVASRGAAARPSPLLQGLAMLFLTAATAAAAQISVPLPFTQVPFTFQPMIVLLAGLTLGARLGCASQLAYLAAGLAGLPVFAASATLPPGALRLLGPTGGYLMAYPIAAYVTGRLAEQGFDRRYVTSVMAMLVGLLIVYACGATWLAFFAGMATGESAVGARAALLTGVYPFVVADLLKLALAAGIVPGLWRLFGHGSPPTP